MEKQDASELKFFEELGRRGAKRAAASLTRMLGQTASISVSAVGFIEIEKIAEAFKEEAEKPMTAIHLQLHHDFSGSVLFIFPASEALRLADLMLERKKGTGKAPEDLVQSALKEMGNILTGSYLISLSDTFKKRLLCSPPEIATDMLQAILDGILVPLAFKAPVVALFKAVFKIEKEIVKGDFLLFLEPQNLLEMLESAKSERNSKDGL